MLYICFCDFDDNCYFAILCRKPIRNNIDVYSNEQNHVPILDTSLGMNYVKKEIVPTYKYIHKFTPYHQPV